MFKHDQLSPVVLGEKLDLGAVASTLPGDLVRAIHRAGALREAAEALAVQQQAPSSVHLENTKLNASHVNLLDRSHIHGCVSLGAPYEE